MRDQDDWDKDDDFFVHMLIAFVILQVIAGIILWVTFSP